VTATTDERTGPVATAGSAAAPPRRRAKRRSPTVVALDALVLALLAAGLGYVAWRVNTVLVYRWDWSVIPTFLVKTDPKTGWIVPNLILEGFFMTIKLAVYSLIIGTVIGTGLGVMRTSKRPVLRWLARLYVEVIRNSPPIIFIFVFFFFLTSQLLPMLGIANAMRRASPETVQIVSFFLTGPSLVENMLAGTMCLGLFAGAYVTEIVRAGLMAVPKGQLEAGRALGLGRWHVFRDVTLPQALQKVLPALAGQFITSIKDSSLISLISIQELTFMSSEIAVTSSRLFEVWIFTGFLYFTICYGCAAVFRRLERRAQRMR
jgi:polar amino acid transport system permease protein